MNFAIGGVMRRSPRSQRATVFVETASVEAMRFCVKPRALRILCSSDPFTGQVYRRYIRPSYHRLVVNGGSVDN
jgi:hypothetical protein